LSRLPVHVATGPAEPPCALALVLPKEGLPRASVVQVGRGSGQGRGCAGWPRSGWTLVAAQVAARRPAPVSAFEIIHQDSVVGELTCFDRLIFKGHLPRFLPEGVMKVFLGVLLKDFGPYGRALSDKVKAHAQAVAELSAGRPHIYLAETHTKARGKSKEDLRREVMARDGVVVGLTCVLGAVERDKLRWQYGAESRTLAAKSGARAV
jgi:hypothetical protein